MPTTWKSAAEVEVEDAAVEVVEEGVEVAQEAEAMEVQAAGFVQEVVQLGEFAALRTKVRA